MTQDEVLSMASAAGFEFNKYGLLVADDDGETDADEMFVRFAALVAAAEREACAAACEAVKQRAEELAKSDFATREGKGGKGQEPEFLQRLRAEQHELSDRQGKLEAFLGTHGFHALADDAKGLLRKQESLQHALLQTLNQRIHSAVEQHLRSKNNG